MVLLLVIVTPYRELLLMHPAVIADEQGVHTTDDIPVYHKPKDECGGGSAWAAGLLDRSVPWHATPYYKSCTLKTRYSIAIPNLRKFSFFENAFETVAPSQDPYAIVNNPAMITAARRCDLLAGMASHCTACSGTFRCSLGHYCAT